MPPANDEQILVNERVRRVNKTITWAASGTDQITVVGPTKAVIITLYGTNTGATTNEPSGGIVNAVARLLVNTNRRGTIWDITGAEAELLSACFYNAERKTETTAAAAETGFSWVLPLSLDPGEMATCTFTFGALADICGTITAYTGAILRMTVVIKQPKSYWAFRGQTMGNGGAIVANNPYTQPQIPIIPGFALCGVGTNVATGAVGTITTNLIFPERWTYLVSHGDDYLIDADCKALRALLCARTGAGGALAAGTTLLSQYGIAWHHLVARFTPVANNDSTQFTITAGTTGSLADAGLCRVVYLYITGQITDDATIPTPSTQQVGGEVTLANPARQLSPSQNIGPAVIPAGTQGGTSLFNLRRGISR